jgi:hypothetical protein
MKMKKKIITQKQLSKLGGAATFKKYGPDHYKKMVAKRWKNYRKAQKNGQK